MIPAAAPLLPPDTDKNCRRGGNEQYNDRQRGTGKNMPQDIIDPGHLPDKHKYRKSDDVDTGTDANAVLLFLPLFFIFHNFPLPFFKHFRLHGKLIQLGRLEQVIGCHMKNLTHSYNFINIRRSLPRFPFGNGLP